MLQRCCLFLWALLLAGSALAQDIGVVMLHGKWGRPSSMTQSVVHAIEWEDWPVVQPTMPWAESRLYDAAYPEALQQIAETVKELRAKGVKRVVVAGHSFGANAALAYASQGGDADAVIVMAPGHNPRQSYESGATRAAVDQARAWVAAGKGADSLNFVDINQGRRRNLSARADVFLSYFDPEGLGDLPSSTAHIPRPLPLFWVIGTLDPLYPAGQAYAYDKVPPHPLSRYLVVDADHANTPETAKDAIVAWLKTLAAQR